MNVGEEHEKTTPNPTIGLLQNRFSSTVQDFDNYGPKDSLDRIGCNWPDFDNVSDWSTPTS